MLAKLFVLVNEVEKSFWYKKKQLYDADVLAPLLPIFIRIKLTKQI